MASSLFNTIPTGDAIQYLNTVTEALPTRIADPIQAAVATLLPVNPQAPMTAQAPQPLAVENPSAGQQVVVVPTKKSSTNTWIVGGVVAAGLAFLMLRKR